MGDSNKYFNYAFYIERILGIGNIYQNTVKYGAVCGLVYSGIIIVLLISSLLPLDTSSFMLNKEVPWYTKVNRLSITSLGLSTILNGWHTSDKKNEVASNLDELVSQLVGLNIHIPGAKWEVSIVYLTAGLYILHITCITAIVLSLLSHSKIDYLIIVVYLYLCSAKWSQMLGFMMYTCRSFRIQLAISQYLDKTTRFLSERQQTDNGPFVVQRRIAWAEGSELTEGKFYSLKAIQTSLENNEEEVKSFYRTFIIWKAVTSTVLTSLLLLHYVETYHSLSKGILFTSNLISNLVSTLVFILVQSIHSNNKQFSKDKLGTHLLTRDEQEIKRNVKHLILHHIHNSEAYNYYLFDMDFSLVATILETTIFIGSASWCFVHSK